jgi:hypothetical protein
MDPEHMKALVLEKHRDQIRRDVRRGGLAAILENSTTADSEITGDATLATTTGVDAINKVTISG